MRTCEVTSTNTVNFTTANIITLEREAGIANGTRAHLKRSTAEKAQLLCARGAVRDSSSFFDYAAAIAIPVRSM